MSRTQIVASNRNGTMWVERRGREFWLCEGGRAVSLGPYLATVIELLAGALDIDELDELVGRLGWAVQGRKSGG